MASHKARLVLSVVGTIAAAQVASSQEVGLSRNPLPLVRDAQDANSTQIGVLVATALDTQAATGVRTEAVYALGGVYFDFLLPAADQLLASGNPEVSQAVIEVIGGQIAMLPSNGLAHGHDSLDPLGGYQDQLVAQSEAVLERAQESETPEVSRRASEILVSRGVVTSLANVSDLVDAGVYSPQEAIRLYSFASPQLSSPYLAPYLQSSDDVVVAAAASTLSYNPDYTDSIRSLILMEGQNPTVVEAALPGLARTDDRFAQYALGIGATETLPESVRLLAVEQYIGLELASDANESVLLFNVPAIEGIMQELGPSDRIEAIESIINSLELPF